MSYIFNTNAIKTAAIALPSKAIAITHPMLDAIHIFDANESRFYEATDGHIAVRVKTKIPIDSDPIPESGFIIGFSKALFKDRSLPQTVECSIDKCDNFTIKGTSYLGFKSGFSYPDTNRIFNYENSKPASEFSIFNPDLLKRAQKALGVKFLTRPLQANVSAPAFWVFGDTIVVVMPYRKF